MPNLKIHTGRPMTTPGNPTFEATHMPADGAKDTRPLDDSFVPRPSYWRMAGDRIARSGRIVGPLALASTASSGCAAQDNAALTIAAIIAGIAALIGLQLAMPRRSQLPTPSEMFVDGVSPKLWHRHLKHLMKRNQTEPLFLRNGTIRINGRPFPFHEIKKNKSVFGLNDEEAVRLAYGVYFSALKKRPNLQDMDEVIAAIDEVSDALGRKPILATVNMPLDLFSEEFSELITSYSKYSSRIKELADIFEPTILHRYFKKIGDKIPSSVMAAIRVGKVEFLDAYRLEQLFDKDYRSGSNEEGKTVDAILHAYFARRMLMAYDKVREDRELHLEACVSHLNSALSIFDADESLGESTALRLIALSTFQDRCTKMMESAMELWDRAAIRPMRIEQTPGRKKDSGERRSDLMWHHRFAPATLRALRIS